MAQSHQGPMAADGMIWPAALHEHQTCLAHHAGAPAQVW